MDLVDVRHFFVANFGEESNSLTEVKRALSWLRLFQVERHLSRFATHRHIPPYLPVAVRCAPVQNRIERLPELNLGRIKVLGLADDPDPGIRLRRPGDRPEPCYSAGGPAHPHVAAHGKPPMLASRRGRRSRWRPGSGEAAGWRERRSGWSGAAFPSTDTCQDQAVQLRLYARAFRVADDHGARVDGLAALYTTATVDVAADCIGMQDSPCATT